MSTTSTPPLSLTTPELPSLFSPRKRGKSILPNSRKIHFHDFAISHRIPNLSGIKSNRLFASSSSADTSFDIQSEDSTKLPQAISSDHWRKNIPVLAKSHRVYSIDLIGYGYSDKPNPREFGDNTFYTFETWGTQLNDFCVEVVKDKAYFICNSIGGLVGLQASIMEPEICRGLLLLNISLRMLHIKKQPWFARPFIKSFQSLLRNTDLGKLFFKSVATSASVKSILCQCYHDTSQVTEELVEKILLPGLEPGAVDVFLDFICYSAGPLPEDLLPQVKCPVLVAWGDKDPWEPIELGRMYGNFDPVQDFVVLPNVGHCPQDEAPDLVNPLVESFVARNSAAESSVSTVS
ncbi:pheophytinase, chloroplastic isoform X2 [Euphorbia lathyris]|uniref:pheophytinase, chloroplastic isoform X2 n=1 Tax=Euphorbia lathyris TaxID=212925 RepID=UPI003313FC74